MQEVAKRVLACLILGIAYSSSIGAIATIMGSGENAITAGLLGQISDFGFLDWMMYGLPIVAVLLAAELVPACCRPSGYPRLTIDTVPAIREIARLGSLNMPQKELLIVLGGAVFLWVAGHSLETWMRLPATLLSSAVVALGAVALLSIEEVIDWNDLRGVNWGVFFVIGAGLTLGDALNKTGASQWFADIVAPLLMGLPYTVGSVDAYRRRIRVDPVHEQRDLGRNLGAHSDLTGPGKRHRAAAAGAAGHHGAGACVHVAQRLGPHDACVGHRRGRAPRHDEGRDDCRHSFGHLHLCSFSRLCPIST